MVVENAGAHRTSQRRHGGDEQKRQRQNDDDNDGEGGWVAGQLGDRLRHLRFALFGKLRAQLFQGRPKAVAHELDKATRIKLSVKVMTPAIQPNLAPSATVRFAPERLR